MENCPLNGQPCDKEKNIEFNDKSVCESCQWSSFLEAVFHGMHLSQMFNQEEMRQIMASIKGYGDLNNFINLVMKKPDKIKDQSKKCNSCGMTIEEMFRNGKLGCPKCYDNLSPLVNQVISKSQEGDGHVGKKPKNNVPKDTDTVELLEEKMKKAVEEERYEDAAIIRNAINSKKPSET